jgi:hypothetical protein
MYIRIKSWELPWRAPLEEIGVRFTEKFPTYEVFDKHLFFLGVIKYGIDYFEV